MSVSQLRVTFFIAGLNVGGAQQQLVHLACGLKRAGASPEVVIGWDEVLPVHADALVSAGVPLRSLNMHRRSFDPCVFNRLATAVHQTQPHVLQSFLFYENILARLDRPLHRVPVLISSVRNVYEGGRWRDMLYRVTDPLVDVTMQNSHAGAERYIRIKAVPTRKMRVIPNIVDTDKFTPNPDLRTRMRQKLGIGSEFVWLSASRLEPAKNPALLLEAFAHVCHLRSDAMLFVAGDGSLRDTLVAQVAALGLGDRVRLLGMRSDLPALMNATDAFVSTSDWEGTPNVVLEASSAGLPVVATDVGGTCAAVQDTISGFVVPSGNVEAIVEHMLTMMNLSAAQRQQMGSTGRRRAIAHYGAKPIINQWIELYLELLAQKRIDL